MEGINIEPSGIIFVIAIFIILLGILYTVVKYAVLDAMKNIDERVNFAVNKALSDHQFRNEKLPQIKKILSDKD